MRSQGCPVTMLSSRGEMRGVRDHSLTVLSLLQLAMVNGRLGWQVNPNKAFRQGRLWCWWPSYLLWRCQCWTNHSVLVSFSVVNTKWLPLMQCAPTVNISSMVVHGVKARPIPGVPHSDGVVPGACSMMHSRVMTSLPSPHYSLVVLSSGLCTWGQQVGHLCVPQ